MEKPFGDFSEIRPLHLHHCKMNGRDTEYDGAAYAQWHIAQICMKDKKSAQVQAVLFGQNKKSGHWAKPRPKADLYWVHLDNEEECAPLNTHIKNPTIISKDLMAKRK